MNGSAKPDPWLLQLLFGQAANRRYTQDSPVLPDVWLAYAANPSAPQELLLTPYMNPTTEQGATTTGQLRADLAQRLAIERKRPGAWARSGNRSAPALHLAHNQSTVLAHLWFDELIRVILPLSLWWHNQMAPTPLGTPEGLLKLADDDRLARLLDDPQLPPDQLGLDPRARPNRDMIWMARLAGTIALLRQKPSTRETLLRHQDAAEPARRSTARKSLSPQIAEALINLMRDMDIPDQTPPALVYSASLNRPAANAVSRSRATVKADAACRVFDLSCAQLAWAIIDSGIDATHPAFRLRDPDGKLLPAPFQIDPAGRLRNQTRIKQIYDFTFFHDLLANRRSLETGLPPWLIRRLDQEPNLKRKLRELRKRFDTPPEPGEPAPQLDWQALTPFLQIQLDDDVDTLRPVHDHGTHVAGILGADWRPDDTLPGDDRTPPRDGLRGLCPDIQLYDIRVLDADGAGQEFNIISALQFLRFLNKQQDFMAVHGANLSLSLRHEVKSYACGVTPICLECERMVADGLVVVAAAGNRGFQVFETRDGPLEGFLGISITDPGNAESVITVGSTHRFEPHSYGVSYFSSRGPTADGRPKPDLVAPGEKIVATTPSGHQSRDGTSMASPHVCGVVALLMARHRELIGHPARIKQILCQTATDLGRERFFQGHGMVDALRALQSV